MTNAQARMICAAILLIGGLVAVEVTHTRDVSGGIFVLFGLVVFLIEFIGSYRKQSR